MNMGMRPMTDLCAGSQAWSLTCSSSQQQPIWPAVAGRARGACYPQELTSMSEQGSIEAQTSVHGLYMKCYCRQRRGALPPTGGHKLYSVLGRVSACMAEKWALVAGRAWGSCHRQELSRHPHNASSSSASHRWPGFERTLRLQAGNGGLATGRSSAGTAAPAGAGTLRERTPAAELAGSCLGFSC